MADHKATVALSLLIFCLLGPQLVQCQFRVFRTGAEQREFEQFNDQMRLQFALRNPGAEVIELTGAMQTATAQEGVSVNVDCLPWLRRFPGGSIRWLFTQLDEFGDIESPMAAPQEIAPNDDAVPTPRIVVGGPFNRWLNITMVVVIQGAEDPDSKIFMCEVCVARGTPFEECHISNYTNRVIGAPPNINETNSNFCVSSAAAVQLPGLTFNLGCTLNAEPFSEITPTPNTTWFKDGQRVATQIMGGQFTPEMAFFMRFPILNSMVFDVDPIGFLPNGQLPFTTGFRNITNPTTGNLAPGTTPEVARAMLINILLGNWTCVSANDLGSDSVSYLIRMCGTSPVIPDCAAQTGNSVIFPMNGAVLAPGCSICIREGEFVTLDCTVLAGTPPVSYSWTANGVEVSQNPTLLISESSNYTCRASNLDNPNVLEASILFFSPRAMITSRIVNRNTNGCDRLRVTPMQLESIQANFDTCIFVNEELEVDCTTDDPNAVLELRSGDGMTVFPNASTSIVVTPSNIDSANMSFACIITNADGPCGQFEFRTSIAVYDPARISRTEPLAMGQLGAGRLDGVAVRAPNTTVTLRCPTTGITDETTTWNRVVEDATGCLVEVPIMSTDPNDRLSVSQGTAGTFNDLTLTIVDFNTDLEGTYVCRTSNIAGEDADIVSLVTSLGTPVWATTAFSMCDKTCNEGVRNRSVTCRNSRNQLLLPDFMCFASQGNPPPSTTLCDNDFPFPCFLDPIWVPFPWSSCTLGCAGGYRYRDVKCLVPMTGEVRPDRDCNYLPPLRSFDPCPFTCCIEDFFPPYCRNEGTGRCGEITYQQFCCWTCGLTVIP